MDLFNVSSVCLYLPIRPQPCEHSLTRLWKDAANMSHGCALASPACRYASAKRWQCHYPGDQETEARNYYQPHAKSFPLIKSVLRFWWWADEGRGETSWHSQRKRPDKREVDDCDRLKEPDPDLPHRVKLVLFNKIEAFWAMVLWNSLQPGEKISVTVCRDERPWLMWLTWPWCNRVRHQVPAKVHFFIKKMIFKW